MISHYLVDPETYGKLREIMTRLYDDRPLQGDARRDLANRMYAVLGSFIAVEAKDEQARGGADQDQDGH